MRPFYHIYQSVSLLCRTGSFLLSISLSTCCYDLFMFFFTPSFNRIDLSVSLSCRTGSFPLSLRVVTICLCSSSFSSFDCIYLSVCLSCHTGSFPLSLHLVLRSTVPGLSLSLYVFVRPYLSICLLIVSYRSYLSLCTCRFDPFLVRVLHGSTSYLSVFLLLLWIVELIFN